MGRRFDYSEWVRAYARYLDEQLEVYARTGYYQVTALCLQPRSARHLSTLSAEKTSYSTDLSRSGSSSSSSTTTSIRALTIMRFRRNPGWKSSMNN